MNQELSLSAICEVICAHQKLFGSISHITTDSREVRPGSMFIALSGERFDGHDFIPTALEKGARCVVAQKKVDCPPDKLLMVGSTERALRRAASLYRSRLETRVVAVTGSVGKTTTRDMTAAVLAAKYHTTKTQGNLNNQIGVPQTVLSIQTDHEAAVVEMGMSGFGEIEEISLCACPNAAIITNIGESHMEKLGSREGIYRAKIEIVQGLLPGAPIILNGDDPFLGAYRNGDRPVVFFGIENPDCAVRGTEIEMEAEGTRFLICFGGEEIPVFLPAMGRHSVMNALAAFTAGVMMGVEPRDAAHALGGYRPTGMRQKTVQLPGGITVVEDCYNASPDSFAAALRTLAERPCRGRRILAASDMLELGEISDKAHFGVGRLAGRLGIDALYAVGERSRQMVTAAQKFAVADARHFETKEELGAFLAKELGAGDVVWFKASRGMKLEEVIERVYKERKE